MMKKLKEILNNIPAYFTTLLLGVISFLSLMLLYTENRRKKAISKLKKFETKDDLEKIENETKQESLRDAIDSFNDRYNDYKNRKNDS